MTSGAGFARSTDFGTTSRYSRVASPTLTDSDPKLPGFGCASAGVTMMTAAVIARKNFTQSRKAAKQNSVARLLVLMILRAFAALREIQDQSTNTNSFAVSIIRA